MMKIRSLIYKAGFRPKLGSIWHSPSLSFIYGMQPYFTFNSSDV